MCGPPLYALAHYSTSNLSKVRSLVSVPARSASPTTPSVEASAAENAVDELPKPVPSQEHQEVDVHSAVMHAAALK